MTRNSIARGGSATRRMELAGSWYPATAEECTQALEGFALTGRRTADKARVAIAPHAGWTYSGSIANNVIAKVAGSQNADTVILFAGHLRPQSATTLLIEGACETPLGPIPVDKPLAGALAESLKASQAAGPVALETPSTHSQDNSSEVLFPIIKHHFPECSLLVVGAAPRQDAVDLADAVIETAGHLGRNIVVIGSTDLTHYGPNFGWTPHGTGKPAVDWVRTVNDRRFIEACVAGEPSLVVERGVAEHSACCPGSAAAAIRCAQRFGCHNGQLLRYSTSADYRASPSFVGYAGIVY